MVSDQSGKNRIFDQYSILILEIIYYSRSITSKSTVGTMNHSGWYRDGNSVDRFIICGANGVGSIPGFPNSNNER